MRRLCALVGLVIGGYLTWLFLVKSDWPRSGWEL